MKESHTRNEASGTNCSATRRQ